MIPKIIHYCWFGKNPLPPLAVKCIESWKKYCPDYEIKEWNESNFDVNCNQYTKEAYEAKKWAFVSDVARLFALVNHGGIYMDTDCELLKPIDEFLSLDAVSGFETETQISTAFMGCRKEHLLFAELLQDYNRKNFKLADGGYDTTTNVTAVTNALLKKGIMLNNKLQTVSDFTLYPKEYFCPKNGKTGDINISENTYAIHHFDGSWLTAEQKQEYEIVTRYRKKYGTKLGSVLYSIAAVCTLRKSGINNIAKKIKKKKG